MIPVKIQGTTYEVPGGWDEVTVRQFLKLIDARKEAPSNPALVLSILTGLEYSLLINTRGRDIESNVLAYLKFLGEDVGPEKFTLPDTIEIAGKRYPVPTKLEAETWGQKITAQMIINAGAERNVPLVTIAAELVGVYLQPVVDGPTFDDKKAEKVAEMVRDSKLAEVWPVAAFFLRKCVESATLKAES